MSLLDEIQNQAEQKRQNISEEERFSSQLEEIYIEKVNPRFKDLYSYFNELINNLNFVDEALYCAYKIPGAGIVNDFYHSTYRISANSSDRMTEIKINFQCLRDKPIQFLIEDEAQALTIRNELHKYKVNFEYRHSFAKSNMKAGIQFNLNGQIPVQIRLFVEPKSVKIKLEATNIPELGLLLKNYEPHEINNEFTENLGHFMLRQNSEIITFDLPAQNRQQIEDDKEKKAQELKARIQASLNNPNSAQENKSSKPGFFKRLFTK